MSLDAIEIGDLNKPAQLLVQNAQKLNEAGNTAPDVPFAGQSTELIGNAIVDLLAAMSNLVESSARAADAVQACDKAYLETEDTNEASIADAGSATGTR